MILTYFAPEALMRGYASRRSSSDASGCSIAVASGWEAAAAEPAPRRPMRTQQATIAIRACLQIVNVSSGEKAKGNPGRPASLEDSVRPLPRFRRNQTRHLHALRTTIRQLPLGPCPCSRRLLARVRPGQLHTDEPELDRGGRVVDDRPRVRRGLLAGRPGPGPALVSGSLLGAFALWTGLSALWAASAEKAFNEFDRVFLFLAIFALAVVASPRGSARRWLAGLALGLTAVGVIALVSRLFPHSFEAPAELAQSFPTASKRLSFPVDYWNALATLVAFAIPCLLYFAAEARAAVRGLAVAPLPALTATLYLTSSRGGWVAAGIAIVVLIALTSRRWATAGALLIGGAASAGAVAVLLARDELVDSPLTSSVAESQGRSAALLIALLCAGAGVAYGLLATVVPTPPRAS